MKVLIIKFLIILFFVLTTQANANSSFPLDHGSKIRIITNYEGTEKLTMIQGRFAGVENDTLYISSHWDIRLDRVIKKDSSTVDFPFVGAQYNAETKSIYGKDKHGNDITIFIPEIKHVDVTLLVKDKQIPSKINADFLHHRLRSVNSYPKLQNKVLLSSITQVSKWKKGNTLPLLVGILGGGAFGYYSSAVEKDNLLDSLVAPIFEPSIRVMGVIIGAAVGGLIGGLIGKSKWQNIPINRFMLSLHTKFKNDFNFTLAFNF